MVGGVDRLSLDSIRCLSSLQVDNEDQRLGIVAVPFHTLQHVVEQVHCGAAHVNGDGVEEEDGVVLGHTQACCGASALWRSPCQWRWGRGRRWRSSRSHSSMLWSKCIVAQPMSMEMG